jgi:hypothetical protein
MAIDTHFVTQFESFARMIVQQRTSLFRKAVIETSIEGEQKFINFLGVAEFQEEVGRHGTTTLSDPDHTRRRLTGRPYSHAAMVDRNDVARMNFDPSSGYMEAQRNGFNRLVDQTIINAMTATAFTGKDGTTQVSFPSTQQVPVDYTPTGTTPDSNLTLDKLIRAKEIFLNNNVGIEPDGDGNTPLWLAIGPDQHSALLRMSQVQSADFNAVRPLVTGMVGQFMGFNFIVSNLLPVASGAVRSCYAWVKSGVILGFNQQPVVKVAERPDLRHDTQMYFKADLGAVRTEEVKVVEILCDEDL